MSNGCGCETGWLRWFRPPYARTFYAACCVHDDDYDRGGGAADRLAADRRLYRNMVTTISRGGYGRWMRRWLGAWALTYYVGVRCCGWKYFNFTNSINF